LIALLFKVMYALKNTSTTLITITNNSEENNSNDTTNIKDHQRMRTTAVS